MQLRSRDPHPIDFAELSSRVGYFARRLQVFVFKDLIRKLAPMDVRPAQYAVLVLIAANPGRSQSAIGSALGIERARLARMLHVLERREWVERSRSGRGRPHRLFLTGKGGKVLTRIRAMVDRHEAYMTQILGAGRRLELLNLLKDVRWSAQLNSIVSSPPIQSSSKPRATKRRQITDGHPDGFSFPRVP